jgi:ribose-phosphate pyrophosphokinase
MEGRPDGGRRRADGSATVSASARSTKATALYAFSDHAALGRRLARRLRWSFREVKVHAFPDGESLVRLAGRPHAGPAVLLRSLDDPNRKLVECILAAETLRERGASPVVLVAPYLGYMRQDAAFHAGEAVSQRIVAGLLGGYFDRLYTVDAHLHRTPDLQSLFPIVARNLTSAPLIARRIPSGPDVVVAGPDAESEQWVRAVARQAGLPYVVGHKLRLGDRSVRLRFGSEVALRGKRIVLVDDIVSSGHTALAAARALRERRPAAISLYAVHALFADGIAATLRRACTEVVATNSVPHAASDIDLAPLLADALRADERTPS